MTADFFAGLLFWVHGWGHLLRHRSLLWLSLMPLMIALAATLGLGWLLWSHMPFWIHAVISWIGIGVGQGHWHDLLYYPLLLSSTLLVFISSIYVVYLLQALVAVPFYSVLADRTLNQLGKKLEEQRATKEWLTHSLRMLRVSLLKTLFLLFVGSILFVFSFLPVLNLFALGGVLLILSFDCMDYSLEAFGYGFRRRLAYFVRNWVQWFGMATGLGLTLLIPGLTLLVIPGAVVGAALIAKRERNLSA